MKILLNIGIFKKAKKKNNFVKDLFLVRFLALPQCFRKCPCPIYRVAKKPGNLEKPGI